MRARLHDTLDAEILAGIFRRHPAHPPHPPKRVRYREPVPPPTHESAAHPGAVNKEAIEVPDSAVRRVSAAERLIAATMTGGTGIHGLTASP